MSFHLKKKKSVAHYSIHLKTRARERFFISIWVMLRNVYVYVCVNVYTYARKRNGPIMGSLIKEAWKRLVHLQTIHLNLPLTWKERDSMARGTLASFQAPDQIDLAFPHRLPLVSTIY